MPQQGVPIRSSSTIRLITAVAVFTLVALACGDDSSDSSPTATLRILAGTVEVRDPGAAFASAEDGQTLIEGAVVRTGADGRAAIEWSDGSVTRLDFATEFRIAELRLATELGGSEVAAEQTAGNSYSRVVDLTETGSRFSIATPTAAAAVQGTIFAVLLNPDGSTTVVVIDGSVVVTTATGEIVVEAGMMVTVDAAGNVTGPTPIPAELLDSPWFRFNKACDEGACPAAGSLAAIEISPADATINVGESQGYTAMGLDGGGVPVGEVPATYDVDGVPCVGSNCTAAEPGDYVVTGTFEGFTATANLTVLATGDIQVTLDWTAPVDLDLWVTDPAGETIMFDYPSSTSGGRLDRDAYPDCDLSATPPENTVWDATAPSGEYLVTVHVYDMCGATSVGFELTVSIGGEVVLFVDDVILTATDETYEVTFEKA